MFMFSRNGWLGFALLTMITWGVWGAFTGLPTATWDRRSAVICR